MSDDTPERFAQMRKDAAEADARLDRMQRVIEAMGEYVLAMPSPVNGTLRQILAVTLHQLKTPPQNLRTVLEEQAAAEALHAKPAAPVARVVVDTEGGLWVCHPQWKDMLIHFRRDPFASLPVVSCHSWRSSRPTKTTPASDEAARKAAAELRELADAIWPKEDT